MTRVGAAAPGTRKPRGRRRHAIAIALIAAVVGAACSGPGKSVTTSTIARTTTRTTAATTTSAPPTRVVSTPTKSTCALNLDTVAITGADGTASAIGWAGNQQGVVTCLGGSFFVQDGIDQAFGFGVYAGGPTSWTDADGYLPAQITAFTRGGADVAITELADRIVLGGDAYVALYARVAITNPTDHQLTIDPQPSAGLTPLATAANAVRPRATATHDYVLAVDRFGNTYPWPSAAALHSAGSFDQHFAHMRDFWNGQLRGIAAVRVPDEQLNDAYRSGFITTQIARSATHLNTGVNGYESEFSHDVVGILANLFTQGDDAGAHALLLEARTVVGAPGQYEDGLWTYSWPWAVYLLKTGDLGFVRANFSTSGPSPTVQPSIERTAHQIAADRTGPGGIMGLTNDIDSHGYWTVDDDEALMGLAAYGYLARQVGNTGEAQWAANEYRSLLAAMNTTLSATMHRYRIAYLPCSMVAPNTANRCKNPEDANWAAPFLFGRWPWDAQLFGAPVSGPAAQAIDATYTYGFGRLAGTLPPGTFGGYPSDYYSTAYNAGYGSGGLASTTHRDQGILSYEFMISHTQSGPFSWWESAAAPSTVSPWTGSHPAAGQGSSPHAWGIANADKVLLDSLVAQAADGTLIVGRGVPDAWIAPGNTISIGNFPTTNGRHISVEITVDGRSVTLKLGGAARPGITRFELPAFVDNIADGGTGGVVESSGVVVLPANQDSVTVRLRHPPRGD